MPPETRKPRRALFSLQGQNVSKKSHPNFLPKSRQFLGPSFEYLRVPSHPPGASARECHAYCRLSSKTQYFSVFRAPDAKAAWADGRSVSPASVWNRFKAYGSRDKRPAPPGFDHDREFPDANGNEVTDRSYDRHRRNSKASLCHRSVRACLKHNSSDWGAFMTGSLGIFWGIPDPDYSWCILTDKTSLAEAEPYGDFLTHPRGHYDVWSEWQKLDATALAKQAIPQTVAYHEYEDFPRGRIVYHLKACQFIIYADRRLQRPDVVAEIATLFAIAPGTFVVRSDAHYRT
jgi:hypothetical protein